jgi:hypothetical protein
LGAENREFYYSNLIKETRMHILQRLQSLISTNRGYNHRTKKKEQRTEHCPFDNSKLEMLSPYTIFQIYLLLYCSYTLNFIPQSTYHMLNLASVSHSTMKKEV